MFKKINNQYININQITIVEYIGIDEKDNKEYCRIFISDGDPSGIVIEGSLEQVVNYLSK